MRLAHKIVAVNMAMGVAFLTMVFGVIWSADVHTMTSCVAALCVMTVIVGFRYIDLAQREQAEHMSRTRRHSADVGS